MKYFWFLPLDGVKPKIYAWYWNGENIPLPIKCSHWHGEIHSAENSGCVLCQVHNFLDWQDIRVRRMGCSLFYRWQKGLSKIKGQIQDAIGIWWQRWWWKPLFYAVVDNWLRPVSYTLLDSWKIENGITMWVSFIIVSPSFLMNGYGK